MLLFSQKSKQQEGVITFSTFSGNKMHGYCVCHKNLPRQETVEQMFCVLFLFAALRDEFKVNATSTGQETNSLDPNTLTQVQLGTTSV